VDPLDAVLETVRWLLRTITLLVESGFPPTRWLGNRCLDNRLLLALAVLIFLFYLRSPRLNDPSRSGLTKPDFSPAPDLLRKPPISNTLRVFSNPEPESSNPDAPSILDLPT